MECYVVVFTPDNTISRIANCGIMSNYPGKLAFKSLQRATACSCTYNWYMNVHARLTCTHGRVYYFPGKKNTFAKEFQMLTFFDLWPLTGRSEGKGHRGHFWISVHSQQVDIVTFTFLAIRSRSKVKSGSLSYGINGSGHQLLWPSLVRIQYIMWIQEPIEMLPERRKKCGKKRAFGNFCCQMQEERKKQVWYKTCLWQSHGQVKKKLMCGKAVTWVSSIHNTTRYSLSWIHIYTSLHSIHLVGARRRCTYPWASAVKGESIGKTPLDFFGGMGDMAP